MLPLASLVITTYNRAHYLPAAIESILNQTYPHLELIIWDDGSTDQSVEIACQYAQQDKRMRVIGAPRQGRAHSLKSALGATQGTYLGWVDSDDLLAPTPLEDTVNLLETHSQIGMVYTNYQTIDQQGTLQGLGTRCTIPYSKERLLVDFMTFHFRLLRRSIYYQAGEVDAAFTCAQDYDLCLKLSEVTQIYHLPKPLYFYRVHAQSMSYQQRLEQILWSKQAIENALHRRNLTHDYELDVQLSAQYTLRRRATET